MSAMVKLALDADLQMRLEAEVDPEGDQFRRMPLRLQLEVLQPYLAAQLARGAARTARE